MSQTYETMRTNFLHFAEDNRGTLVFVERKKDADYVARHLIRFHYAATSIHSDRDQSDRERALRNFRNQLVHVLVATSVASRGLGTIFIRSNRFNLAYNSKASNLNFSFCRYQGR